MAVGEAVAIYRSLANTEPDIFAPLLAGALRNLGMVLSILGREEEADDARVDSVPSSRNILQLAHSVESCS